MFCNASVMIAANLACAVVAAGVIVAGSMTVAGLAMLISNDPGGPMFLPMAAMAALLAAALASGALFAITLVVEGLRRLAKAPWWAASLTALPAVSAASAVVALLAGAPPRGVLAAAAAALLAIAVYWHAFLAAQLVLARIAARLFPDRACAPPAR